MALTQIQLQALKAYVESVPAWQALPRNSDTASFIADELNKPSSPPRPLWNTNVDSQAVLDAVDLSKYTPVGALDDATLVDTLMAARRQAQLLACQTKQINLQLLTWRPTLNANKLNIRNGLRDAVIQVPSGAAGAVTAPGGSNGANVLIACTRQATQGEAVLRGSDATTGTVTAALTGFEGQLVYQDIEAAWSV